MIQTQVNGAIQPKEKEQTSPLPTKQQPKKNGTKKKTTT